MTHAGVDGPVLVGGATEPGTGLVLVPGRDGALPRIVWVGSLVTGLNARDIAKTVGLDDARMSDHDPTARAVPLLPAVADGWVSAPALTGHHVAAPGTSQAMAGIDWAPDFTTESITATASGVQVEARDDQARLAMRTDVEAVSGGLVRLRHTVTNVYELPYLVEGLDVLVPVPDRVAEVMDLTGRWGRERAPQRHAVTDGTWVRESRGGRPGHGAATALLAGTCGFGFGVGEVWAAHVAWSGNSRLILDQQASGLICIGGGELLLPGEIVLGQDESYQGPWVYIAASDVGSDGVAAQFHAYLRSLPAHPRLPRPVVSNVWEAVYFDHDLTRLTALADLAASVGAERIVLDDGWFGGRRDDTAGLGDWTVSPAAWPAGLRPFVDHVQSLGLQFGLWFEPEMVNPDSDLYRAHPDWILAAGAREPALSRHQLVLDLGRAEVRDYLFGQLDAILSEYPIAFVKWDHNRPLYDASARDRDGAPGAHAQTVGFYDLLDRLRDAHPDVDWESCASGGGRIDLGVLERVQRVWTSDMTDALARQHIQRWTLQLVAPEYLGAHVSAPVNHQTGRAVSLDFRAATAFFGDFGIEWDLAAASTDDLARLRAWIDAYKQHRELLHSGVVRRIETPDPALLMHGVVAADRSGAVFAYVQLDETVHDLPPFLVSGLEPDRRYEARVLGPEPARPASPEAAAEAAWRGDGMTLSGATLAAVGLPAPARRPASSLVVSLTAV